MTYTPVIPFSGLLGHRLVHVRARDQHREDAGDVAGATAVLAGPDPLAQRRDHLLGRGREGAQRQPVPCGARRPSESRPKASTTWPSQSSQGQGGWSGTR